jgi:hypothetical protein
MFVKQASKIDWSVLVSKLIKLKLDKIMHLQKRLSKSALTEEDIQEKHKEEIFKRLFFF